MECSRQILLDDLALPVLNFSLFSTTEFSITDFSSVDSFSWVLFKSLSTLRVRKKSHRISNINTDLKNSFSFPLSWPTAFFSENKSIVFDIWQVWTLFVVFILSQLNLRSMKVLTQFFFSYLVPNRI